MKNTETISGIPAPICDHAGLPSFADDRAAAKYFTAFCPSCPVKLKWTCDECGGRHWWVGAPPPAGGSSGTGRHEPVPVRILKMS